MDVDDFDLNDEFVGRMNLEERHNFEQLLAEFQLAKSEYQNKIGLSDSS